MKFTHPFLPQLPSAASLIPSGMRRSPAEHPYAHMEVIYRGESEEGEIEVREGLFRGYSARLLLVNGAMESAIPAKKEEEHVLLFSYMRLFDRAFALRRDIRTVLLIGGGGFAWPRHALHGHPGLSVDVVERSASVIDVSRRFFRLAELEEGGRLRVLMEDGFNYLLRSDRRYDLILNDAFIGSESVQSLLSPDGISLTRAHLTPGGISATNLIMSLSGPSSLPGHRVRRHAAEAFRETMLLRADESLPPREMQNFVLFARE